MDDRALVERARVGDESALNRLLERHRDVAWRIALGIVGDPDLAADVVQEALLKAFRGLDGFRGEARFRSWMLTIVVHEARGAVRRRGRRGETGLDDAGVLADDGDDPARVATIRSEAERARACLARLPEKQRLAVALRIDEGLSFKEVAEVSGSTEGAARVNYHHGIRKLREMMETP